MFRRGSYVDRHWLWIKLTGSSLVLEIHHCPRRVSLRKVHDLEELKCISLRRLVFGGTVYQPVRVPDSCGHIC